MRGKPLNFRPLIKSVVQYRDKMMNCSTQLKDATACLYHALISRLASVDWVKRARLIGTATLITIFQVSFCPEWLLLINTLATYVISICPLPNTFSKKTHFSSCKYWEDELTKSAPVKKAAE